MCLQLADQTLCYPKRVIHDVPVHVGSSFVPADFVVIDAGLEETTPIILGRPFLCTAEAIMYVEGAKIIFNIKGRIEKFKFKGKKLHHPDTTTLAEKTNSRPRENRGKQP